MTEEERGPVMEARALPWWLLQVVVLVELWELGFTGGDPREIATEFLGFVYQVQPSAEWDARVVFAFLMRAVLPMVLGCVVWLLVGAHSSARRWRKLWVFFVFELVPGVNFLPFFLLGLFATRKLGTEPSPPTEGSALSTLARRALLVLVVLVDVAEAVLLTAQGRILRTPWDASRVFRDFAEHPAEVWETVCGYIILYALPAALGALLGSVLWRRSLAWRRRKLKWFLLLEVVPVVSYLPFFSVGLLWTAKGAKRERELFGSPRADEGAGWTFRPSVGSSGDRPKAWTFRKREP